jgi:MFS family permease
MPYGSFSGVVAIALPYLLRKHGMAVEGIASVEALVQAPSIWYVLWAPVVDIKFRRRTWIVLLSVGSGVCTAAALCLTMLALFRSATALFVVASAINQPVSSALGGLAAVVMPDDRRGRAAGWSQAGIVSAGVATGALAVWLGDRADSREVLLTVGTVVRRRSQHWPSPSLARSARADSRASGASATTCWQPSSDVMWLGIAFFRVRSVPAR